MNIGQSIDRLYALREQKRDFNVTLKEIDTEYAEIEHDLLKQLGEQGVSTSKSKLASATVSESIVPAVEDWDQFYKYILETDSLFMLEKRPSVTAYRDLLQAGEVIPGVSPFNKITLSLRKL